MARPWHRTQRHPEATCALVSQTFMQENPKEMTPFPVECRTIQ